MKSDSDLKSMKYEYDKAIDRPKMDRSTMLISRVMGLLLLLGGGREILLCNEESSTFSLILSTSIALVGGIWMLFPTWLIAHTWFRKRTSFVKIDDLKVEWKLGKSKAAFAVSEVASIDSTFGEIHFHLNNGKLYSLPVQQIESETKYKELIDLLKKWRTN